MARRDAQSILEYVIVLTAIVAAFIAAAQGPITNAVNKMFADSSKVITDQTGNFSASVGRAGQNGGGN